MDHFAIIQALCRAALASPSPAVRKQIERLRDSLLEQGESKQAAVLTSILTSSDRSQDMAPSRIRQSKAFLAGEAISDKTPIPVDKETATPLAEVVFPSQLASDGPLFAEPLMAAIKGLLDEWANIESLIAIGAPPPRSCVIFGAPGTGKTRLALWIAKQLDLPVVLARLDSLVSSFLGTSSRNIANLFAFANRYRCLLLLDEFDAIAKLRDDPHESGEIKRVVNALMQHLDLRHPVGLTIGITNHPQLLDPAVWRRFEVQLEIPKPDFAVRLAMANHFIQPVAAPDAHMKVLAWSTEGASGAEIEALVRAYKKNIAVNPNAQTEVLQLLRMFTTLNTGRISEARKRVINGDESELLKALRDDTQLGFRLEDLGILTGHDKSTMSRRMVKSSAPSKGEG